MDLASVGTIVAAGTTVAAFASVRFNRPSWSRSYTTAARYYLALGGHILLYLLLLAVFYSVVLRGLVAYGRSQGLSLISPDGLWIAVFLTLGVRAVPAVSVRTRAGMHRLAGIPNNARDLAALLATSDVEPPSAVRETVQDLLLSRGFDTEEDCLPGTEPAYRLLTKAAALFVQLRRWDETPGFRRFVREARNDLDVLRRRFDRLSFSVARTYSLIERLGEIRHLHVQSSGESSVGTNELDVLLRRTATDLVADSCDDIGAFYDDACLLAARGAMATRPTDKGRAACLAQLGFKLKPRRAPKEYKILFVAFVLLYVGIWMFFSMVPRSAIDLQNKWLITVVSLIVFGSVAIAIVPKMRWGFANGGLLEKTPTRFVVGAGFCAVLFAVGVNLIAGAILIGGLPGALERLRNGSPYLPSMFVTAAAMAWLAQDHRWRSTPSPRRRRLWDGLTLGFLWLLFSFVGSGLRVVLLSPLELTQILQTAVAGFAIGGALGYVVPESAREVAVRTFHEASSSPIPVSKSPNHPVAG